MPRHLLILDLDETLVHAIDGDPYPHQPAFSFATFHVLTRPHLTPFLAHAARRFDLAVWTSASGGYARPIVQHIFPDPAVLKFIWCHDRCTLRYDPESRTHFGAKNLSKLKRLGHHLDQILILDDSPEKVARHYGNHIRIAPFTGDPADTALRDLLPFLDHLALVPNVRRIEKRHWRSHARDLPPAAGDGATS